ncbi:hypothetical protein [Pedobacter sp. ok626]|uniref:hypothetical protein n=1 Tax=Pedobacter sp. ok626 TaxID=1761882 RepID=UPI00104CDDE7|nr:hypothetical protein [Pedobacter sp. ok626]
MKSRLKFFCCTLFALMSLSSCKKTMDLPQQSNSKIIAYKVPVSDGSISGVIDETDKTITVYLPFYYNLDVIDPEIKLATGAKLSVEVLPVDVLDNKTTYTVTGADKSTATYKLVIKLQQISPLKVNEVSTESKTVVWGIGYYMINLSGNFNTLDPTKIRIFLVGADNTETEMSYTTGYGPAAVNVLMAATEKVYSMGYVGVPQTLDPGLYKVRVKVQSLTTDLKYPVTLEYILPQVDYVSIIAKQGDTFTIKSSGPVFKDLKSITINVAGQDVSLPVLSYSRTLATVKIPETVPVGTYYPSILFEGFPIINAFWPITVNAK